MIKRLALATTLLAAAAAPALAESGRTARPIEAVSLHGGALDMVAYYTVNDAGTYVVVATFAEKSGENPRRVTMELQDGDSVDFAMPGHQSSLFGFAREDGVLNVSVDHVSAPAAQLDTAPRKI